MKLSAASLRNTLLVPAATACYFVAGASTWVHPIIVNGLVNTTGFGPEGAGSIIAIEMAMMSLASLAIASRIDRLNPRNIALIGLVLTLFGNLILGLGLGTDYTIIAIARGIAGLGEGMMLGVPAASLAAGRRPDRNYAIMTGTALLLGALMLALVPSFEGWSAAAGIYWLLFLAAVLAAPLVVMLPTQTAAKIAAHAELADSSTYRLLALIAAVLVFGSPAVAVWVNIRLIAGGTDIASDVLPLLLSVAVFISLAGSILAMVIGTRFGRLLPATAMLILQGIGVLLLTHTSSAALFTIGAAIEKAGAFFLLPYFLGAAAALEKRGSHAAAISMAWMLCGVSGPLIGGYAIAVGGGPALGWMALSANLIAICLMVLATWKRPQPAQAKPQ